MCGVWCVVCVFLITTRCSAVVVRRPGHEAYDIYAGWMVVTLGGVICNYNSTVPLLVLL